MQMFNKRGQAGRIVMLFWTTVIIFVILMVFFLFASIFIALSEEKMGLDSRVYYLDVGSYMIEYKKSIDLGGDFIDIHGNVVEEGEYNENCDANKGEIEVVYGPEKGKCVCNSVFGAGGYYSKGTRPYSWFSPPCEKGTGSVGVVNRPNDVSLEYSESNKGDMGICVVYFSNRFYTELSTDQSIVSMTDERKDFEDLYNYEKTKGGFVNRVYVDKNVETGVFYNTRLSCSGMDPAQRIVEPVYLVHRVYNVFYRYSDVPENIDEGYNDDIGYCILFYKGSSVINSAGGKTNIGAITTREDCYNNYYREKVKDQTVKGSFFMTQVNIGERFVAEPFPWEAKNGAISVKYSPDYFGVVRGNDLEQTYVEEKCEKYEDYDLTFITGTGYYQDGEIRLGSDGEPRYLIKGSATVSACRRELLIIDQELKSKEKTFGEKFEPVYSDDVVVIDEKDLCCYINEVKEGE